MKVKDNFVASWFGKLPAVKELGNLVVHHFLCILQLDHD